ncbi:DUF5825 family protein [Streptomyces sp. NPDC003032]
MSTRPVPAFTPSSASVPLPLWRDRDPAARRLPGMYAGSVDARDDPLITVPQLAADGVQYARLPETVDLSDPDGAAAVASLVAVREFTSFGIAVDWTLRLPGGRPAEPADWRPLSHLHPPTAVLCDYADDGIATQWRDSFHAAKCGYRHGPGFIEVRDRRSGSFKRLVIRNTQHDRGIQPLLRGAPEAHLPQPVIARYTRADLLHRAGRFLWWTPYRIRRWPLSTTIP